LSHLSDKFNKDVAIELNLVMRDCEYDQIIWEELTGKSQPVINTKRWTSVRRCLYPTLGRTPQSWWNGFVFCV